MDAGCLGQRGEKRRKNLFLDSMACCACRRTSISKDHDPPRAPSRLRSGSLVIATWHETRCKHSVERRKELIGGAD